MSLLQQNSIIFSLKFSRRTQHQSCHPRLPIKNPFTNTTADIQAVYKIHHLQDLTNPSTHYITLVTLTHQWIECSSVQHKDCCLLGCDTTWTDISEKCVSGIRISE